MLPWETLQALETIYKTIRVSNGYLTDIGANTSLENPDQTEDSLPDLVITGRPNIFRAEGNAFRKFGIEVFLESRIPAGRTTAQNTAWKVLADLIAATPSKKNVRTSGLPIGAHSIEIDSAEIGTESAGRPFIIVQVTLLIGLATI